ncbi:MAG: hypothetical protein M1824_001979 [Vezdaea acicularis]|nr:MAG: hypothetical protein M1824_001979 [Vezdaea acicularis]
MPDNDPDQLETNQANLDLLIELLAINEERYLLLIAMINDLSREREATQGELPEEAPENSNEQGDGDAPQIGDRLDQMLEALVRLRQTLDETAAQVPVLQARLNGQPPEDNNPPIHGGDALFVSDDEDEPGNDDDPDDDDDIAANADLQALLVEKLLDAKMADLEETSPCAICKEEVKVGEPVLVLSCAAKHWYCPVCAREWLGYARTCPSCREEL